MSRTKSTPRAVATARKTQAAAARGTAAATDKARKDSADQDAAQAEWEDASEELDVLPDIDGLLARPAVNRGSDPEARRRIEMLREDRLLQQALSDVFDL